MVSDWYEARFSSSFTLQTRKAYIFRAENSSKDLESFAKHAGRTQINADDVLLLARRNEGLESLLRGYVEDMRKTNGAANGRSKGKTAVRR